MRVAYPIVPVRFQSQVPLLKAGGVNEQRPCEPQDAYLGHYENLRQALDYLTIDLKRYTLPAWDQCPPPVQETLKPLLSKTRVNLERFTDQVLENQFGVLEEGSDVAFFFLLKWGVQQTVAHSPLLSLRKRRQLRALFPKKTEPQDLVGLLEQAKQLIPDFACHQILAKLPGQSDKTSLQWGEAVKQVQMLYAWILIESVVHERVLNRDNFNLGTIQENLLKEQAEWDAYTKKPGQLQLQANDSLRLQYVLDESNALLAQRRANKHLTVDDLIRFQCWKVAGRTASLLLNPDQAYQQMKQPAKAWEKLFESAILSDVTQ